MIIIFHALKSHLGDKKTVEKLKKEVIRHLRAVAGEFYDTSIKKNGYRMQKCIDRNGDYVEK